MTNEELQEEIKRLEEQLTELRFKISKSKVDDKPYKVEVPEDIETYYILTHTGYIQKNAPQVAVERLYKRGLAFKTKEEAEQYDKERILIFKMNKWAEERNGDWTPNWEESDDKFYIDYHHGSKCFQVKNAWYANAYHKLPYFKSAEIAYQFIEEFVDEINEVLC